MFPVRNTPISRSMWTAIRSAHTVVTARAAIAAPRRRSGYGARCFCENSEYAHSERNGHDRAQRSDVSIPVTELCWRCSTWSISVSIPKTVSQISSTSDASAGGLFQPSKNVLIQKEWFWYCPSENRWYKIGNKRQNAGDNYFLFLLIMPEQKFSSIASISIWIHLLHEII